jgi:hypothetical protein
LNVWTKKFGFGSKRANISKAKWGEEGITKGIMTLQSTRSGRIYAKGKADDPECSKDDFSSRRTKKVHFDLGLGRCGMKSLRSVKIPLIQIVILIFPPLFSSV